VVGYNLAGGATSIGVFIKNASGGAATIPDVAGAYIPRDNNVHHVTLSFAPCVSPPTQICISGWIDNRTVWAAQPIPGTSLDSLNLARDWQQRFVLNRPGAPGWNGALHGLRIANRPSTQAEHQARTIASLAQADSADTFVLDFTEGGGFPKEKVVERAGGARPASGLLPVIWGERGTLHASYEFLDRFFGVRWYMPGNLGLAYTTRTSVSLPLQKLSLALPLRYRFAHSPLYLTPLHHLAPDALGEAFDAETRNLWALRMRLGGEDTAYNHAFYDFKANQVQAHPEWFALDANNNRNQACLGNQAFVDKVGAYAQAYAQSTSDAAYFASATDASRDMRTVKNGAFSVSPLDMFVLPRNQDGSLVGTDCNVQSAQAAGLVTTGYPVGQFFSGTASNYVFDFYNRVATAMQSATPAPGRNPRITGLAYMDYAFPPSTVAIHPSVNPVVNFDLKGWGTTSPQATGRAQLTAWNTRMGTAGYYGWTYLIDSVYGLYTPPSFEYGRLATATNEAFGMGIKGLTFEHSYTWDARSPVRDLTDPVLGPIIEDFRNFVTPSGYRKLWEEWPMSLSLMFEAGPGHAVVFNCKNQPGENKAESYEPLYSPYCARYNNALPQNQDVFTRLDPLLRASTEARGTPDAQLDSYLLLRRMADPNFDANAAITEFFTLYYGSAGGPLRAFHDLAALIPAVHTITSCNQPSAYEKNKCLWQARVPVAQLNSLNSFMTQARTAVPGPGLSPVQAKRVKAFDRNVWCLFARSYYMFYDNADALRAADPMHLRQACIEDPNLKTYVTSEMRYVVE